MRNPVWILTIFISLAILVSGQEEEDWRELHNRIYATEAKDRLKPEQTRDLLKQLRDLYNGREDPGSRKRHSIISNLLMVSEVSKDRCLDTSKMNELVEAVNYDKSHVINVVPYVDFYMKMQLSVCKDEIEGQFRMAKKSIGPDVFDRLKIFANRIHDKFIDDEYNRLDLTPIVRDNIEDDKRARDPAWYLKQDENPELHDASWYFETYLEPVYEVALEKLARISYVGMLDKDITRQLDADMVQLLRKLQVIKRIIREKNVILRRM